MSRLINVHIDRTVQLSVSDEIADAIDKADLDAEEGVIEEAVDVLAAAWAGNEQAVAQVIFADDSVEVL